MNRILTTLLIYLLAIGQVWSQAALLPNAKQQFVNELGVPYSGGTVDFYIPNTGTRKTTWQNANETTPNTNPVTLDAAGRAVIYGSGTYRQVLKDASGNTIWDASTASTGSGGGGSGTGGLDGMVVGTILPFSGFTPPTNYDFAYGQAYSRTAFSALLTAITISQTGSCVSTSTTVSVSDTSNMGAGMPIEMTCLLPGTTISSVTNGTNLVVSAAATGSATTGAVVFPYGDGDGSTTFNLPDMRGRTLAGRDNMGGTAASRLTASYFGNGSVVGTGGGAQSETLTIAQMPTHTHSASVTDPGHNHAITDPGHTHNLAYNQASTGTNGTDPSGVQIITTPTGSSTTGITINTHTTGITVSNGNTGNGEAHTIVQPTIITNYIIKVLGDNGGIGVVSIGGITGVILCGTGLTCSGQTISASGGTGTVSSVALSGGSTGLTVSDSPITTSGTMTLSGTLGVANGGTGGGTFTANAPILGNGTSAFSAGSRSGNTTSFGTTSGALTNGHCVSIDGSGTFVDAGGACTTGGGGGTVSSGTAGQMTYYASTGTVVSGNANATISAGALTLGQTGSAAGGLKLSGSSTGLVTVNTAAAAGTWNLTLPTSGGTSGQFLQTNGSGVTTWASVSSAGTVTSVASGTGLTGGPITTTGTLSIANTAVSAGSYSAADITVNAQGQLTSAANGAFTKTPGGVTTTLARHAQSWASVVDYMSDAQVTGASSATTALQAMLTSICGTYGPSGIRINIPGYARLKVHDISATCAVSLVGDLSGYFGSTIDYSGSTTFGLKFERTGGVAGAPVSGWLQGVRLEHLNLYASGGSTTAVQIKGCQSCIMSDITLTGVPWNGILIYGGENISLENINDDYKLNEAAGSEAGLQNRMIEIYGDKAGLNRSSGACTLGDCSTRVDDVFLRNIVHAGNSGNPVLYIHDMAFNTLGDHIFIENGNIALQIYCNSGFPDISYCPAEINFADFQAEGATNATCAVCISDANQVHFTRSYVAPNNPITSAHAVFVAGGINYSQAAGSGGFRWQGGTMFNSTGSLLYVQDISDTTVTDSMFMLGNTSGATTLGNGAGIEYTGADARHKSANNTFCNANGAGATGMQYGVKVNSATFQVQVSNSSFYGCGTGGILNNSSQPATVVGSNNLGP